MFKEGDKVECTCRQSAADRSIDEGYMGTITHVDGEYVAVDNMLGYDNRPVMCSSAFTLIAPAPVKAGSFNPIYCRDRIKEIDALVESLEEERVSLVQALEKEGFPLIKKINKQLEDCKQSHEDMSDWKNWKEGDNLLTVGEGGGFDFVGEVVKLLAIGECGVEVATRSEPDYGWYFTSEEVKTDLKFHSRTQ